MTSRELNSGAVAEAAAEAVRALNHATLVHGDVRGYRWPSDVDQVVANLALLAERLPQALDQAARWLSTMDDAGLVDHDERRVSGTARRPVVAEAVERLQGAAFDADRLAAALRRAQAQTSHLIGLEPDGIDAESTWS